MTSVSNLNERKSTCAIVQSCLASNDDKQQDKYLIAHMIPIGLTIVERLAALRVKRVTIADPNRRSTYFPILHHLERGARQGEAISPQW
jgi:hypothetical protein